MGLNQIVQPTRNLPLEPDGLSWFGSAENLHRAQGGQLQAGQWRELRIRLGDHTCQLCRSLHQQDARENRLIRKVPAQERLVAAHNVFTHTAASRVQREQTIQKAELGSVRQERSEEHTSE